MNDIAAQATGSTAQPDATPSWSQEIVTIYPRRTAVPQQAWRDLFAAARDRIDVLVYAGNFVTEDDELMGILADRATAGVHVRILLGDADSLSVARRGDDEGINGELADMARAALAIYRARLQPLGAQIRLHDTPLYNSIYRADDQMLVNQHVYGLGAGDAPVTHLRQHPDGRLFTTYQDAFERVWDGAVTVPAE